MIGRRTLVAGAAGGIMVGLTGLMLTRNQASIRFIGRRQTIIALLDTSTERVLFVLGEQDDDLLANVPGLTTVGNTRIDLVVATHRVLASRTAREYLRTDTATTLAITASESLPPIRGNVSNIMSSTGIELGDGSSVEIDVTGSSADHPDFLVSIRCSGNLLTLASHTSALRLLDTGKIDLLALPGSSDALAQTSMEPQLLVSTSRSETLDVPQVVVFQNDPSIIRIGAGTLSARSDQLSS